MRFMAFFAFDVEVMIRADKIISVDAEADTLIVKTVDGVTREYPCCCAVRWAEWPEINGPDDLLELKRELAEEEFARNRAEELAGR